MKGASLCAVLALAACSTLYQYNGPNWHGWAIHAGAATASTLASEKLVGTPWIGAALACGFYIGHEWEETRGFTVFYASRKDSAVDMLTGCSGLTFSLAWP